MNFSKIREQLGLKPLPLDKMTTPKSAPTSATRHRVGIFVEIEPPHNKTNKMICAPGEDSDQPGHPPSLIRVHCPHEETLVL